MVRGGACKGGGGKGVTLANSITMAITLFK